MAACFSSWMEEHESSKDGDVRLRNVSTVNRAFVNI